jgi:excisionase family DNA binding protein
MTKMALSVEEASVATGIGRTSIYRAIGTGRLRAKKHGVRTLILPEDLEAWLSMLPDAGRNSAGDKQDNQ